jgi:hypothetical protein
MPKILKTSAKVSAAINFLDGFYGSAVGNRCYIGLGDAGGEWAVPLTPDTPTDSYQEEYDFWDNLVGAGQLTSGNNTELVVQKKVWTDGTTYVPFDDTDTSSFTNRDFYVINSADNVYSLTAAGPGNTSPGSEPTHTVGSVVYADGYEWRYMYTIGSGKDVSGTMLSDFWMPVPTPKSVSAWINDSVYEPGAIVSNSNKIYQTTSGGTTSGTNPLDDVGITDWAEVDFAQELGASYVACTISFPDYAGTGNKIPNTTYRQVSLLRNPRATDGSFFTGPWAAKSDLEATPVTKGVVLTVDNRVSITRAEGQTETIRIIMEF